MIRGVIFDLGNTLMYFDSDWDTVAAQGTEDMCNYLNERGYTIPVSFAESFRTLLANGWLYSQQTDNEYTTEHALNDALTQHSICWVPDAVLPRAVEKFYTYQTKHWFAYTDARSTLEALRARGLKLGLLSNANDHAFVEQIATNGELASFFDPLLSSAKISHRKPDPRAFLPILQAWQLPPSDVLMVGDYPSFDILGAHRAGMRGVLILDRSPAQNSLPPPPHAEFADGDLMEPDAVIRQLAELPATIDTLDQKEN